MSAFNDEPVVVGKHPTTYGEIRTNAAMTVLLYTTFRGQMTEDFRANPDKAAQAFSGMARVVLFLLGEVERLSGDGDA